MIDFETKRLVMWTVKMIAWAIVSAGSYKKYGSALDASDKVNLVSENFEEKHI
jgi:hypothetical protein